MSIANRLDRIEARFREILAGRPNAEVMAELTKMFCEADPIGAQIIGGRDVLAILKSDEGGELGRRIGEWANRERWKFPGAKMIGVKHPNTPRIIPAPDPAGGEEKFLQLWTEPVGSTNLWQRLVMN